jgi:hypothetical protein
VVREASWWPAINRIGKIKQIPENLGVASLNISLTEEGALRYFGFGICSPHVIREKEYLRENVA